MLGTIRKVLVTGATGYIGGRLVPRLIERGYLVRCFTRHPSHLKGRGWTGAEIVGGDALSRADLARAMKGIDAAYFLIHSMAHRSLGAARMDFRAAGRFAHAARAAGVKRVVYLGGLGAQESGLSRHLRSRQKVGEILRSEGPPVTEFRAAVIIGSGSVSFEMIRYIVDRMPVIPAVRWLRTRCQPIAVRDVLNYLTMALEIEDSTGRIIEIGGGSVLTYQEMMEIYARRRGLRRFFMPFPRVPAALSAAWIELVSPIPAGYARPLIECLRDEVVCRNSGAELFPIQPLDYETALRYALLRMQEGAVETTWSLALFPEHSNFRSLASREGLIGEERTLLIHVPARAAFAAFSGIGGERGWFYMNSLWVLRAWIDRCLGGVGLRRGRRNPDVLRQGEPLDFWRVEKVIDGRLILLRAEMRLPGRAWLEFESLPQATGRCLLRQAAYFEPKGLGGYLYWYALYPFHQLIFAGLVREIARRAKTESSTITRPAQKTDIFAKRLML